jgi:hypothetical protein
MAMAGVYRAEDVGPEEMMGTVTFLERGAQLFPDDGELAWDLAATLLYEIAPRMDRGPERAAVERKGNQYLLRAARLGGGPPWLALTNASQLVRLGRMERAVDHLEEMYAMVHDRRVRARIAERLEQIEAQMAAEGERTTGQLFEWQRERDFPYLSTELYLLVGPRRLSEPGLPPVGAEPDR